MTLSTMPLPDSETVAFITLYGVNRSPEVTKWHRRVMVEHHGLPVNYIECPFHLGASHGQMMNHVLAQTVDTSSAPTYYWWLDNDALLLKKEVVAHAWWIVRGKQTLWGQAWRNSHKPKPRAGDHPYCSQACLLLSRDLYKALGRPDCDHHGLRSDTAEELTYACEAQGYSVCLQWPSYSDTHTTELGQISSYGRGNVYGPNLTYHESRADLPGHVERFIAKCQWVLNGAQS